MQGGAIYMKIAYTIVCAVYFGYALLLWRRNADLKRRAARLGLTAGGAPSFDPTVHDSTSHAGR